MNTNTLIWVLIAFGVYLMLMVVIGAICMKDNNTSEDYFLGGRRLNGFVTAMSAQASDMSGWLLMGLPGSIYAMGAGQAWIGIGLLIGTVLNWIFVASRLREYTIVAGNSLTLPEFFSDRFKDDKNILLSVSSIVIVIFFLIYTASALSSGGKLFNSIFGIDYHVAIIMGVFVVLLYTFMGGFLAVCKTDMIQGILMLIALLSVPVLAYSIMGPDRFSATLIDSGVNPTSFLNIFQENGNKISTVSLISSLAWGLGYFGMPHILVRFMAVKNERELKKSKVVGIVWVVLSLVFACFIGILGRAYLYPVILGVEGGESTENVFIEMIKQLFINDIHAPFIAGIFLCAILAAIMSTADSQLLVASSSVAEDFFNKFLCESIFKKKASDSTIISISRITVCIVAILAFIIAWNPDNSVMALVSDAWAGFGAAFGPLVLCALFWKRTNLYGALSGIISGAVVVLIWDYIPFLSGNTISEVTGLYSLVPGFFISLLFIVVVSMTTPAPSNEIIEEFDKVDAICKKKN